MSKYDVITIGSATRDVFIEPEEAFVAKGSKFETGSGLCFSLGSKIDVPDIKFRTGGSAINSAVTFARQGLRVAALCKIGQDTRGESIKKRLEEDGISTSLVMESKDHLTAYSVILVSKAGRTILVHRGATEYLCCEEPVPYDKLKNTKWFYITNLGGESSKIFKPIIDFAHQNNIKVALNPGKAQLKLGKNLKQVLGKIDILILNQEEASYLTGVAFRNVKGIFKELDKWTRGMVLMTRGPKGFVACDNANQWEGGILKEPRYADRTGAGDAFGAGFVSSIINGQTTDEAIQLASSNATGVLGEWGANHGLLATKNDIYKFGKLKIKKSVCKNL